MLFNQVLIEYELGEFNQGEAHLQQLIDVMSLHQPGPSWAYAAPALAIPMVARITRVAERLDIAEAAATTILSSPFCTRRIALVARASLGLMAVLTGNVEVAREHYAALKSAGGTILTATTPTLCSSVTTLVIVSRLYLCWVRPCPSPAN
jgi:hypothetical protein